MIQKKNLKQREKERKKDRHGRKEIIIKGDGKKRQSQRKQLLHASAPRLHRSARVDAVTFPAGWSPSTPVAVDQSVTGAQSE